MRWAAGLIGAWLSLAGSGADAGTSLIPPPPGHVKVTVEFRQAGQSIQGGIRAQGTGPGGSIVEVGPKGVTGSARVQVQESQQTVRRTVGSFLLIQDGGEGRLIVAEQVPEMVWFQQYALERSYISAAVIFRQVGTAFVVHPTILPDKRVRLRITPQFSYRSDAQSGTIELVEASTEVVVRSGQPLTIGGNETSHEVVRQFLIGYEQANRAGQVSLVLTAETP